MSADENLLFFSDKVMKTKGLKAQAGVLGYGVTSRRWEIPNTANQRKKLYYDMVCVCIYSFFYSFEIYILHHYTRFRKHIMSDVSLSFSFFYYHENES